MCGPWAKSGLVTERGLRPARAGHARNDTGALTCMEQQCCRGRHSNSSVFGTEVLPETTHIVVV